MIAGDYNADPFDGDSFDDAIRQLLQDPAILGSATDPAITPASPGGPEQAALQGGINAVDTAGLERLVVSTVDGGRRRRRRRRHRPAARLRRSVVHHLRRRRRGGLRQRRRPRPPGGRRRARAVPGRRGRPGRDRSDAKGVEPEAIEAGEIRDDVFLLVGLERGSGIAIYDLDDPTAPALVDYIDGFAVGDLAPETPEFVSAEESVTGEALLLAPYELSGATVAYTLAPGGQADPLALC